MVRIEDSGIYIYLSIKENPFNVAHSSATDSAECTRLDYSKKSLLSPYVLPIYETRQRTGLYKLL